MPPHCSPPRRNHIIRRGAPASVGAGFPCPGVWQPPGRGDHAPTDPTCTNSRHPVIILFSIILQSINLRFYYRFLAARQRQFALNIQDQALSEISRHLIDFIGAHTWEELCREWTLRAGAQGRLPCLPDEVGSAWNRSAQIDVAGINTMEKTLVLGECKWTLKPADRTVMANLVEEKIARIVPKQGTWRVHLLGFSRSGWTSGALAYQEEIQHTPVRGENWVTAGMRLLDLAQVDEDLTQWSA